MAIFIGDLAFDGAPQLLLKAKMGILFASLLAGIGGFLLLRWIGRPAKCVSF